MNEETELWAAYKAQQKLERAERRASAEQQLKDRGINHTVHNGGAHIVIEEGGAIFDYWPGNTRWRMRPQKSQYGVGKLFAAIAQRRVVSQDFSKLEERVLAQMVDAGTLTSKPGAMQYCGTSKARFEGPAFSHSLPKRVQAEECGLKLGLSEEDAAFVERMTRAFPHLGEEA